MLRTPQGALLTELHRQYTPNESVTIPAFPPHGALTNDGSIRLSPGRVLTVSGSFTQASTGALALEIGGSNSAPTFGRVVSTAGTVTLAGSLTVTSTVVPSVGSPFEVLDNGGGSAVSGTFAGLPAGATFTVKSGGASMTFEAVHLAGATHEIGHAVRMARVRHTRPACAAAGPGRRAAANTPGGSILRHGPTAPSPDLDAADAGQRKGIGPVVKVTGRRPQGTPVDAGQLVHRGKVMGVVLALRLRPAMPGGLRGGSSRWAM
jgi:hypothetical protein